MIDLDYPRERMLADLGVVDEVPSVSEPEAPEFVEGARSHLLMKVHHPEEVLPRLRAALSRRFAGAPEKELERSLLSPLKKAVGNAHKRGNGGDPDKWIQVEAIVTRLGAFVQVSDQGEGFDVRGTLEKFRAGEPYFAHSGSGFRRYTKARSVISFADGGSTLLLRYLSPSD